MTPTTISDIPSSAAAAPLPERLYSTGASLEHPLEIGRLEGVVGSPVMPERK